jgi:enolase
MIEIEQAGFVPGDQVAIALDPAASELFESGQYILDRSDKSRKTPEEIVRLYEGWVERYPIISIEVGVAETPLVGGCSRKHWASESSSWGTTTS